MKRQRGSALSFCVLDGVGETLIIIPFPTVITPELDTASRFKLLGTLLSNQERVLQGPLRHWGWN